MKETNPLIINGHFYCADCDPDHNELTGTGYQIGIGKHAKNYCHKHYLMRKQLKEGKCLVRKQG